MNVTAVRWIGLMRWSPMSAVASTRPRTRACQRRCSSASSALARAGGRARPGDLVVVLAPRHADVHQKGPQHERQHCVDSKVNDGGTTRQSVVGATSAVAQSAIRLWAARGAALALVGRNQDALDRVAADARVRAASVSTHAGDLADLVFIESLCATTTPAVALVAHGSLTDSAHAETSAEYLDYELTLNFVSAAQWRSGWHLPCERAGGGTVVAISSVAGDRGAAATTFTAPPRRGSLRSAPACVRAWPRAACTSSPSSRVSSIRR